MTEKEHTTSNGSLECFKVQVRIAAGRLPQNIGGHIFDNEWRFVETEIVPSGVPNRLYNAEACKMGYLSYEAAMSLAWWVAAAADASMFEIRLVAFTFEYSYTIKETGQEPPIVHGAYGYQARVLRKRADVVLTRDAAQ